MQKGITPGFLLAGEQSTNIQMLSPLGALGSPLGFCQQNAHTGEILQ